MLCSETCPRGETDCEPIANLVCSDGSGFVCAGKNDPSTRELEQDWMRHCFKNPVTDTMYDYDEYDAISVISVLTEGLLHKELTINEEKPEG